MGARLVDRQVNVRGLGVSPSRRLQNSAAVARHHISLVRLHVPEILRVLAKADRGRLHYGVLQHLVNQEEGKHVSGLNVLLDALAKGGVVRKLPEGGGYEITPIGRQFQVAVEKIAALEDSSTRNGGVGGR